MSTFRRALLIGFVLLLAGGAVRLAFWQLDRRDTRRAANSILRRGQELPALSLAEAFARETPLVGRIATARGRFLPEGDLLLRGRILKKAPGLEVMTPFALDSGAGQVWVLRGFVKSPDATTPPDQVPLPTPGSVTIRGLLLQIPETNDSGQRLERLGRTTYRRLDRAVAAAGLPGAPAAYLLLDGDSAGPGGLPAVLPPTLDDGPHFSYAIQWFCIALAILAFGVIALRRADPARPRPPAAP